MAQTECRSKLCTRTLLLEIATESCSRVRTIASRASSRCHVFVRVCSAKGKHKQWRQRYTHLRSACTCGATEEKPMLAGDWRLALATIGQVKLIHRISFVSEMFWYECDPRQQHQRQCARNFMPASKIIHTQIRLCKGTSCSAVSVMSKTKTLGKGATRLSQ